jgi:glyoxylase-like metal-dependent hydrolase (beta-lactamase superfamily II)
MKKVSHPAPGILMLGPYGPYRNAVWLLVNGDEAALVEMPPYRPKRDARPWQAARRCLRKIGARLKYALLSHAHLDHCLSLMHFRETFPEARFVGHRSQLENRLMGRITGWRPYQVFDEVFESETHVLDLNGEPLLLIHCPKHSESDLFIIYRGTAITGDWFLGDLKDCNALVDPQQKIWSIERVQYWLNTWDYGVVRAFSGHGDCLYYDVDFHRLMEKSKIDHSRRKLARAR